MFNPRVAEALRRQSGVISRRQALACELTLKQIDYLQRTGRWRNPLPRVYLSSEAPHTELQSLWAAWLYAGPRAVLSHASAARLWDLDGIQEDEAEAWISAERNTRAPGIRLHRTRRLHLIPKRTIQGLRVTSPERTIIDLASRLEAIELEWAVERLRAQRLLTVDSVRLALDRAGSAGRVGAARLRNALDVLAANPSESRLEVRVARLLRDSGLPAPERQLTVAVDGHSYRLDFAWAWRRVALECDGRRFHSDPAAFRHDRERWTNIGARLGFRIVFVTWNDVEARPEWIVEQVATALR